MWELFWDEWTSHAFKWHLSRNIVCINISQVTATYTVKLPKGRHISSKNKQSRNSFIDTLKIKTKQIPQMYTLKFIK